ncbi:MAG: TetR/AcrR family transcriptional regulator, partial [Candidatus Hydrogenedens sp.]
MAIEQINEQNFSTEERLLKSALKLFSEKGYEGTSIREIIEDAGVTRPVLYYYFQNKEDLFRKLVESIVKQ